MMSPKNYNYNLASNHTHVWFYEYVQMWFYETYISSSNFSITIIVISNTKDVSSDMEVPTTVSISTSHILGYLNCFDWFFLTSIDIEIK